MEQELVLAGIVRDWAAATLANEGLADSAVAVALSAYAAGASVSEACVQARRFVLSWVDHPAHAATIRRMRERLAS